MTPTKTCLQCGQTLHGRLDKKFCDDQCRSQFNNQLNSDVSSVMRNINYILRRNRRILASLIPSHGRSKIDKSKLLELAFDFKYFTHYYENTKGQIFKICYDFGYLLIENEQILLINCKKIKPTKFKNPLKQPLIKQERAINIAKVKEFQDQLIKSISK